MLEICMSSRGAGGGQPARSGRKASYPNPCSNSSTLAHQAQAAGEGVNAPAVAAAEREGDNTSHIGPPRPLCLDLSPCPISGSWYGQNTHIGAPWNRQPPSLARAPCLSGSEWTFLFYLFSHGGVYLIFVTLSLILRPQDGLYCKKAESPRPSSLSAPT